MKKIGKCFFLSFVGVLISLLFLACPPTTGTDNSGTGSSETVMIDVTQNVSLATGDKTLTVTLTDGSFIDGELTLSHYEINGYESTISKTSSTKAVITLSSALATEVEMSITLNAAAFKTKSTSFTVQASGDFTNPEEPGDDTNPLTADVNFGEGEDELHVQLLNAIFTADVSISDFTVDGNNASALRSSTLERKSDTKVIITSPNAFVAEYKTLSLRSSAITRVDSSTPRLFTNVENSATTNDVEATINAFLGDDTFTIELVDGEFIDENLNAPDFFVTDSYGIEHVDRNDSKNATVTLTTPLFSNGTKRVIVRKEALKSKSTAINASSSSKQIIKVVNIETTPLTVESLKLTVPEDSLRVTSSNAGFYEDYFGKIYATDNNSFSINKVEGNNLWISVLGEIPEKTLTLLIPKAYFYESSNVTADDILITPERKYETKLTLTQNADALIVSITGGEFVDDLSMLTEKPEVYHNTLGAIKRIDNTTIALEKVVGETVTPFAEGELTVVIPGDCFKTLPTAIVVEPAEKFDFIYEDSATIEIKINDESDGMVEDVDGTFNANISASDIFIPGVILSDDNIFYLHTDCIGIKLPLDHGLTDGSYIIVRDTAIESMDPNSILTISTMLNVLVNIPPNMNTFIITIPNAVLPRSLTMYSDNAAWNIAFTCYDVNNAGIVASSNSILTRLSDEEFKISFESPLPNVDTVSIVAIFLERGSMHEATVSASNTL